MSCLPSDLAGAIVRIHQLECFEDEGVMFDDKITLDVSIDGGPKIGLPASSIAEMALNTTSGTSAVGFVSGSSGETTWSMERGTIISLGLPVPVREKIHFWLTDWDGIDDNDQLGDAGVLAFFRGHKSLSFEKDGANYKLSIEVVDPTAAGPDELYWLAEYLGISPSDVEGCSSEPPTEDSFLAKAVTLVSEPIARSGQAMRSATLDAAVLWDNGKAYFFKGDEYWRYDVKADKVDDGFPAAIKEQWQGL